MNLDKKIEKKTKELSDLGKIIEMLSAKPITHEIKAQVLDEQAKLEYKIKVLALTYHNDELDIKINSYEKVVKLLKEFNGII